MTICPQCGRNDFVIPCLPGKPGAKALARAKRGEVKLSGCTRSASGWCTACRVFIDKDDTEAGGGGGAGGSGGGSNGVGSTLTISIFVSDHLLLT